MMGARHRYIVLDARMRHYARPIRQCRVQARGVTDGGGGGGRVADGGRE